MNPFKRISVFLVATVLLAIAGCASKSEKQGGGGSYFGDAAITAKVKKAIYSEPSLKVTGIGVNTEDQVVRLTGSVKSRADRAKAAQVAGRVDGVKRVKNELQVKQ